MSRQTLRLKKSFEKVTDQKLDTYNIYSGLLGVTINGAQTIEIPNRAGYVYVRLRDNLNELIQVYNDKVSPIYDLPVLVAKDELCPTRYKIVGRDLARYQDWGNSPFFARHGNQHSYAPEVGGGGDIVWVSNKQFLPFLVTPSGSLGSMDVKICPYTYYYNSGYHYAGNSGTASFAAYKPTISGTARMVLVYLDKATGNFPLLAGDEFPENLTGTIDVLPYLPNPPTNSIPLAGVRLVSGTSTIIWNNIYDVRPFFSALETGSSGGGGVTDHGDLTGLDEDDHTQYSLVDGTRAFTGDVTIGAGAAGVDYSLIFDGENNDGKLTWKEDENYFLTEDHLFMPTDKKIYFQTTGTSVYYDSVNTWLAFESDNNFAFINPTSPNVAVSFYGDDLSGWFEWEGTEGYFEFHDEMLMNGAKAIYFRDTDLYIGSNNDGHLDLEADVSIDLNGNVETTGDLYFVGAGSGLPYGSMYTNDAIAVTMTDQNTWYQIDAAQAWTTGLLNLCTFTDPYIVVTKAGKYLINWSISGNVGTANQGIGGGIMLDQTTIQNQGQSRIMFLNSSRNLTMGGTAIVSLTASQKVSLAVRNITSGGKVFTTQKGNLTVTMIGG